MPPGPSFSAEPLELSLKSPFRIAHGTSRTRRNVLVRLGDSVGEGALPPYYPHDLDEATAYLQTLDASAWEEPQSFLQDALDALPSGPAPARAAIDMALHDRWGRQMGHPLFRLWGLNPHRTPPSALTLSIPTDHSALRQELKELRELPVLKLKVGTSNPEQDLTIVRTAREMTDAELAVDANGAWSVAEATRLVPQLTELDVLYIEQPIAGASPENWNALHRQLPAEHPPIIADESIQNARDLVDLAPSVDGINVKVAKAGGLAAARTLIALARTLDLRVLLGCMIESSIALTAAAHLAPLADYADLDAQSHLTSDPFQGVILERGRIQLPDRPGLGVRPRTERDD